MADGIIKVEPLKVRVRYSEVDRMGLLYHCQHLEYFELARSHWIRSVWKPYREIEDAGLAIVVIHAEINYHRPAFYDDELWLYADITGWGGSRIEFGYRIIRNGEETLLCSGRTVHSFINRATRRPVKVPEDFARLLSGSPGLMPSSPLTG